MYWLRKVIIFDLINRLIAKYLWWYRGGVQQIPVKFFFSKFRDVTTGAFGTNAVASTLSDLLTLLNPGGGVQIMPSIAPWIHL